MFTEKNFCVDLYGADIVTKFGLQRVESIIRDLLQFLCIFVRTVNHEVLS